jgi:hypothetical protein
MIGWNRRALRPLATTFGGLIGRARARPIRFHGRRSACVG